MRRNAARRHSGLGVTHARSIALCVALACSCPPALAAGLPVVPAEILKIYPHDPHAFTEGLFFHDGLLFESTGLEGQSTIRAVELETGRVIRSVDIPGELFGEGIAPWKDELVSVTWRSGNGFRWSLNDFHRLGDFHYAGEGWGLTEDGRHIILSDGTSALRFLDPQTLKAIRFVNVKAEGRPVEQLNELEYVKGEILANIWTTNRIARVDPATGVVKGWIDVSRLAAKAGGNNPDAVPNGIAYDSARDRLFLTGKDWPYLFQVRVAGLSGHP